MNTLISYRPPLGTPIEQLVTPCLILDLDALEHNIGVIAKLYEKSNCKLRPHIKNHKCPEIAKMQIGAGGTVGGVCTAKVSEAEIMAESGIHDILIANQIVGVGKLARVASLAKRAIITIACDDVTNVINLSAAAVSEDAQINVLVEINTSLNRAGSRSLENAVLVAQKISTMPGLHFEGIMSHQVIDGTPNQAIRFAKANSDITLLLDAKAAIEKSGLSVKTVSTGETWSYDAVAHMPEVTEVQAGSYILLDTSYNYMTDFHIAAKVLGTITSVPRPGFATGDVSIEAMAFPKGLPIVERPEGVSVSRLTYEQTFLDFSDGINLGLNEQFILLPAHEDMMVNRWNQYIVVRNGIVEDVWEIKARGMVH